MKSLKYILLSAVMLAFSGHALADSIVTVHDTRNGHERFIKQAQTLAQLVTEPSLIDSVWWPGALIAMPSASMQAQAQYQAAMKQLAAWKAQAVPQQAATIAAVEAQMRTVRVAGRQFVSLDPDVVRLNAAHNLQLTGDYTLWVGGRPDTVTVMGALDGAGPQPWQAGKSIRQYLQGHARLAGADKNVAVVIRPDGSTQTAPVAYWNSRHIEAEPGSLIWVGFSSWALPREFASLNEHLISVLTRRIPD
ncbi:capsule biosynthesis GfcC family protein [Cedecea colo]|nr:capsule biosynthesis GfcC family protein [Cedecea colo]